MCIDQLNAPNLVCMEIIARRAQLIKEAHVLDPQQPSYDAADLWMGTGKRAGGALISRALAKHVATRASEQTATQKERRKAREERKLGRQKKPPKGEGKGNG